jgi:hypothetical protein
MWVSADGRRPTLMLGRGGGLVDALSGNREMQVSVTITPAGPAGTSVKGFLEVSTINLNTISGDTLAAFPYAYRIQ